MKKRIKAQLILENGIILEGEHFGYPRSSSGEIVFSTGMVGYPESLTDPSYYGQILVLTYPLIGNYGVHENTQQIIGKRYWESDRVQVFGLIIGDLSVSYSHWNAERSLSEWMYQQKVPGISRIDTRALTRILREKGTMKGKIIVNSDDIPLFDPNAENLIPYVSQKDIETIGSGEKKIALLDCGCKSSIIDEVAKRNAAVTRYPWDTDLSAIDADGYVISSGPGDPAQLAGVIEMLKRLIILEKPLLGICLGHQLLGLAAGGQTFKMRYGHRSQNQPVMNELTGKAYITSQNHGFVVDSSSLPKNWIPWFTNLNDKTNEGLRHAKLPILSSQFHPEASPGPQDTTFIFDDFMELIK